MDQVEHFTENTQSKFHTRSTARHLRRKRLNEACRERNTLSDAINCTNDTVKKGINTNAEGNKSEVLTKSKIRRLKKKGKATLSEDSKPPLCCYTNCPYASNINIYKYESTEDISLSCDKSGNNLINSQLNNILDSHDTQTLSCLSNQNEFCDSILSQKEDCLNIVSNYSEKLKSDISEKTQHCIIEEKAKSNQTDLKLHSTESNDSVDFPYLTISSRKFKEASKILKLKDQAPIVLFDPIHLLKDEERPELINTNVFSSDLNDKSSNLLNYSNENTSSVNAQIIQPNVELEEAAASDQVVTSMLTNCKEKLSKDKEDITISNNLNSKSKKSDIDITNKKKSSNIKNLENITAFASNVSSKKSSLSKEKEVEIVKNPTDSLNLMSTQVLNESVVTSNTDDTVDGTKINKVYTNKVPAKKMNNSEKTREEIKAEREAKKAAKAAAKAKSKQSKTETKDATTDQCKIQDNEKDSQINKKPDGKSNNNKNKAEIHDVKVTTKELESNKKSENKDNKETEIEVSETGNVTIVNSHCDGKNVSSVVQNEGKSKAELRAERRAKQEAQRAAKQQSLAGKNKEAKSKPESKETIKLSSSVIIEDATKTPSKKINAKGDLHEINLFKHLYHERELALMNVPMVNSNIHPAIIRLGIQYANKIIVGSNARCVALLAAVKQLVKDFQQSSQTDFVRGLEASLQESTAYLHHCRPLAVSMQNALRHLKWQMTQLPSTVSNKNAKNTLENAIDTYISEQIQLADKAISQAIQTKISNGNVILTYGYSSLINKILLDAHTAKKQFRVIVVDGRPCLEGKEQLRRLAKHGIECSYVLINALSYIMPEVSKVFLGAHAILANGAVMARVGTAQVALMAQAFNVPVLVACETHKSCERVQTDSIVYNELGDADELTRNFLSNSKKSTLTNWRMKKCLNLLNITYDVTPADLVTAVVTELAILPCTSVPVILRIKPSEI